MSAWTDPATWVLALNAGLLAFYLVWMHFHWGGPDHVAGIAALIALTLGLSLSGMAWRASHATGLGVLARLGWRLIALGCLAYWLGNCIWFYNEILRGVTVFPSLADVGYLSFVPLVLAGLLCFIRPLESRVERIQFWLDCAVVAIGVGTLVWHFLLHPISLGTYANRLELLLTQAYPVGDTVLLFGVAALALKRRRGRSGRPLAWLVAGLLCHFIADIRFALEGLQAAYVSGGLTDACYNLSYFLMMVGPWLEYRIAARGEAAEDGPSEPRHGLALLPYLSVAVAYGLLLVVAFGVGQPGAPPTAGQSLGGLIIAAVILTALVLARQVLSARELARLRAEQAARDTQAHFASLVRHSSDVICLLGPDYRIRFVSPAVRRVLGLDPVQLTGSPLLDLLHPRDRSRATAFLKRVLARSGAPANTEWRLGHADGSWRDMETLATNLSNDPTVGGLVLNCRDVTERRRLEGRLRQLAFQDPLTGLANRTLFRERVGHALSRTARVHGAVTLVYLDIDDFKGINDSLGHAAGDALLRIAAERLRRCARRADTVARLGGDELAVLIEEALPTASALALAQRIGARLAEPIPLEGREVRVTASIGIAQGGPPDGVDTLLARADLAMYAVKNGGKHGQALFEPHMYAAAMERIDLETDLRRALEQGELRLHYQPIIHLPTGELAGVEALVRWQHPRRGLLPPDLFIPLAEEKTELMLALGRWVLREACHQGHRWQSLRPPGAPWHLGVNISVKQCHQGDLIQEVEDALEHSGLDPRTLVLELTESALMQGTDGALRQLQALKAHGVRLAIDDFGVGYSSLAYLQRLPVDILKIDKSFVAPLADGRHDARLSRAIVAMGTLLDLETVAEGVEHACQAEVLQDFGCGFAQGYHFSRPLDAATLAARWLPAPVGGDSDAGPELG